MAEVIQFDSEKDRLCALEALDEADETYEGIPDRRFLITTKALSMLRSRGIRVRVLGRPPEEGQYVPHP